LAGAKSKRKRRKPATQPRAVASDRRERHAERQASAARAQSSTRPRQLGTVGERPAGPFGGLPVSEIAIFAGIVGVIVGLVGGGPVPLIVGIIVCALGVLELTAREHFSGFRSHSTLLAALPAVAVEVGLGMASGRTRNPLLLLIAVPVFGVCFMFLRRRFQAARQARLARPPTP
jgi:hypothetical protein